MSVLLLIRLITIVALYLNPLSESLFGYWHILHVVHIAVYPRTRSLHKYRYTEIVQCYQIQ